MLSQRIVLKWFSPEPKAQLALHVYDAIKQRKLTAVAPIFLLVEVMNILVHKKHVETDLVRKIIHKISTCGITFEDLVPEHIVELQQIVATHKVSTYDGLYILSAQNHGCQILTEDQELLKLQKITIGLEGLNSKLESN